MDIKFSIIIPTYNSSGTLVKCLDSILMQSYMNYEVIIIDALSTDETSQIINSYVKKFSSLQLVLEKDEGIYDAMNKGIKISQGNWLYFLGSDDVLFNEDVFENISKFILANKEADLIYGDVIMNSSNKRYAGEFDILRLHLDCNICHQAIFYKKEIFEKLGNFNVKYKIWADWDFNIRCFRHPGFKCLYIDKVIANYNDISGISKQDDAEMKKELPIFYIIKYKQQLLEITNSRTHRWINRVNRILSKLKM